MDNKQALVQGAASVAAACAIYWAYEKVSNSLEGIRSNQEANLQVAREMGSGLAVQAEQIQQMKETMDGKVRHLTSLQGTLENEIRVMGKSMEREINVIQSAIQLQEKVIYKTAKFHAQESRSRQIHAQESRSRQISAQFPTDFQNGIGSQYGSQHGSQYGSQHGSQHGSQLGSQLGSHSVHTAPSFLSGERVEVDFNGKGKFFPAVIYKMHPNSTYDIDFDDGDFQYRVNAAHIRYPYIPGSDEEEPPPPFPATNMRDTAPGGGGVGSGWEQTSVAAGGVGLPMRSSQFAVGDRVEANFRGKGRYYPGHIVQCHANGTFDMLFDDSDYEFGMHPTLIRLLAATPSGRHQNGYQNGSSSRDTQSNASSANNGNRPRSRGMYASGQQQMADDDLIVQQRRQQQAQKTAMLQGDAKMQSMQTLHNGSGAGSLFHTGDRVTANFPGQGDFHGFIFKCRPNGTFDVKFDNGEHLVSDQRH
jgi:hypothetical protein